MAAVHGKKEKGKKEAAAAAVLPAPSVTPSADETIAKDQIYVWMEETEWS